MLPRTKYFFGVLLVLFRYTVNPRLLLWACRHGNRALAASSGTRGRTANRCRADFTSPRSLP